uniref:Neurotransmitter-gated ion-channel transmembrane domain-containing protein n=1 Tax=Strigamia maritima TaxID=126957 RepID=T1IP40_STRMM
MTPSQHSNLSQPANVSRIIDHLLQDYDIRLRPNFGGQPLRIGMDLTIASFDSISEVNMTHFFANDKNSYLHDVTERNVMVRLYGDGYVAYGMRFTTTLACMMDLHYYPLDSQNCTVEIENGYTVLDVVMNWENVPVRGVEEAQLPQVTIIGYETTDRVEILATGSYQRLSLIFQMQRNIGYFIFQTYLPSILIVQLSWVSFWINHEATSARVALGITTVLTMTTISTGVRSSLPRISYVKAIDIYLVMCFVFVFAALLEYAAVNYTYWDNRAKKKKPIAVPTNKSQHLTCLIKVRNTREEKKLHLKDDIIDLQDIHLSPIPSLRKRQKSSQKSSVSPSRTTPIENVPSLPPSFRLMNPHSPLRCATCNARKYGRRKRVACATKQRLLQNLKKSACALRSTLPCITDVSIIDRVSRIVFPVSFIIFNAIYWGFYIF